jgi:DnaK suppressor protein
LETFPSFTDRHREERRAQPLASARKSSAGAKIRRHRRLAQHVPVIAQQCDAADSGREGRRMMDTLRQDLQQRRATITRALQATIRSTRDVPDRGEVSKDPYGSASTSHDDELAAITVDRLARDLKLIDAALADIDAGRYGICVECEGAIAPKRLKALPFATRCVECQAQTERLARAA